MASLRNHTFQFDKSFDQFTLLTKDQVTDFVSLFYRYGPTSWTITMIPLNPEKDKKLSGQHATNIDQSWHRIALIEKNIRKVFDGQLPAGGNRPAPTAQIAAASILVHEIQHANQSHLHNHKERFYEAYHYHTRPCERDARQFVDEKSNEIYSYFGLEIQNKSNLVLPKAEDEIRIIADLLSECQEFSIDDVRDELRRSKILNPSNVQKLLTMLHERGVSFA